MRTQIIVIIIILGSRLSYAQLELTTTLYKTDSKVFNLEKLYAARKGYASFDIGAGLIYTFPKQNWSIGMNYYIGQRFYEKNNKIEVIMFDNIMPNFVSILPNQKAKNRLLMKIGFPLSFPRSYNNMINDYFSLGVLFGFAGDIYLDELMRCEIGLTYDMNLRNFGIDKNSAISFHNVLIYISMKTVLNRQSLLRRFKKKKKKNKNKIRE